MDIRDKITIVTGASSGIGAEIARELARQGAVVVLAARRAAELDTLKQTIEAGGGKALAVPTDVSERADLERLVQTTVDTFGRIDVLVNNAGASPGKPIDELDDAEIRRIYDVNLLGPTRLISLVVPHMKRQGSGAIVNIGSVAGEVATSNIYAASKFGIRGLNDAVRRELRHDNIKVVLVSPGFVRTAMTYGNKLPMPGPEIIAHAVVRGIRWPRRKIVAPWPYIPAMFVSKLFPALADVVLGSKSFQRSYRKRKQLAAAQTQQPKEQ